VRRQRNEAHLALAQARLITRQRIDRGGQLLAIVYQAVQRDKTLAIRQGQAPHFLDPLPLVNNAATRCVARISAGSEVICWVCLFFIPPS
jgi:hypothetical protein